MVWNPSKFFQFLGWPKLPLRKSRQRRSSRPTSYRHQLEALERRIMPVLRTWDGGGVTNFTSEAANWVGDIAPSAGEDLEFAGAIRLTPVNNVATATFFNSITFSSGGFTVSGNSINLGPGGVTNLIGTNAVNLDVTLTTAQTITSTGGTLTIGGMVAIGSSNVTIDGSGNTTISGVISGAGSLTKAGAGTLTLSAPNTYTGATTINTGTLQNGAPGVLPGNTALTVNAGGAYNLAGFNQLVGSLDGGGMVTLGSATLTVGANNTACTFSGVISGTIGGLTKVGTGTLTLSGPNSYIGPTVINTGTLANGASNVLSDATGVFVTAGATYNLGTFSETIRSLEGAGNVFLGTPATLTVNGANVTTFSGVIGGTGSLVKEGPGALTLTGANTFAGSTTINDGTLVVTGSLAGAVTVTPSGNLKGTGPVGNITASGGAVKPGDPGFIGILTGGTGSFTIGGGLDIQVSGFAGAGISYDQLNLGTNPLFFDGSSLLILDLAGLTVPGTVSGIVLYGSVSGTFGSVVVANNSNGFTYTLVYNATSLDVILAPNALPTLAPIGPQVVDEGNLLTFTATASDTDTPTQMLTFSLGAGTTVPAGANINPFTGVFGWRPTEDQGPGIYDITVCVTDNGMPARSDCRLVSIRVNEVDRPPVVPIPPGPIVVPEGLPMSFRIPAFDPDMPANRLVFSLEPGAPLGMLIDPDTGVITGTPPEGPATVTVTVRVTEVEFGGLLGPSTTQTFSLVVENVAPLVNAGPDASVLLGNPFFRSIAGRFFDPGADLWVAGVDFGDGSGRQPLSLNPDHTFGLGHLYASPGIYTVTVAVGDGDGGLGFDTLIVHVVPPLLLQFVQNMASGTVQPGSLPLTLTASGIQGTLTLSASSLDTATFTVALYSSNPETVSPGTAVAFYDVQVIGANQEDTVTVTFTFGDAGGQLPTLMFFDDAAGQWRPVRGTTRLANSLVIDLLNHTITVTLDATSLPNSTGLLGTVFTVAVANPVPTSVTVQPTVASASDIAAVRTLIGPGQTATFLSSTQLTMALTASQDSQVTTSQPALNPQPRTIRVARGRLGSALEESQPGEGSGFWPWLEEESVPVQGGARDDFWPWLSMQKASPAGETTPRDAGDFWPWLAAQPSLLGVWAPTTTPADPGASRTQPQAPAFSVEPGQTDLLPTTPMDDGVRLPVDGLLEPLTAADMDWWFAEELTLSGAGDEDIGPLVTVLAGAMAASGRWQAPAERDSRRRAS